MPYSDFTQFAQALCDCAGVAAPLVQPDLTGTVAFHLVLRDVVVNVLQLPAPEYPNDDVFILVTFGAIPADMELSALQMIAEANYTMLGAGAPVFGLNPATGEIVIRQQMCLSQVVASDAYAAIERLAQVARQWRIDPTLAPVAPQAHAIDLRRLA
ncbi:MAG: CesT family type III secretion system chaperone [Ramlibacter sp.]|nr:CesT family type III secretion system chaperone [Ramlibacter sp.]